MDANPVDKESVIKDTELLTYLTKKVQSSFSIRQGWETQWGKNVALYMGDHKNALEFTGMYFYAMMNLTAQVIDTKASHLNAMPIRPVVVPRDNNEPVEWYFTKKGIKLVSPKLEELASAGLELSQDNIDGTLAMEEDQVNSLKNFGFTEDCFVALNDDLTSEAITQELQSEWIMDSAEQWLVANNSDKLVIGQADGIVQWNSSENRVHFETLYPYDVFVDPVADSFCRASWIAIREIMKKSEAKERWPLMKDEIHSQQMSDDPIDAPKGNRYKKNYMDDDLVVHWTLWERNAEVDMTEEEASKDGKIIVDELTGRQTIDGEEVTEKNWPKKLGVRQLELLGDIVMFNGESPFGGIPVDRNYNVRAVASAHGIGDPARLADLQDLINRILSQFAENIAQFRSPMLAMPETVFSALEEELKRAFTIAGMKLPVPDSMWEATNGQVLQIIAPPQIPQSAVQLFEQLTSQFFRLAGLPGALRGDTQSGTSGRAMEISTSNASEPIAQVARHTEMFLRKLLHTAVYLIIEYMPTEVFCERNKRFEPHVFEAMRAKVRRIGYDVDVQVSGTNRQDAEAQRMITLSHNMPELMQSPTFAVELLKKMGLANSQQIANELLANRQSQMMAAAAPPSVEQKSETPVGMNKTGPRPGAGEAR